MSSLFDPIVENTKAKLQQMVGQLLLQRANLLQIKRNAKTPYAQAEANRLLEEQSRLEAQLPAIQAMEKGMTIGSIANATVFFSDVRNQVKNVEAMQASTGIPPGTQAMNWGMIAGIAGIGAILTFVLRRKR